MLVEKISERWTYQEMVKKLPAESRYELREYNLIEMPSPTPNHQRITKRFFRLLDAYAEKSNAGEVFFSPIDVVFEEGEVCEPDIVFVSTENAFIIKDKNIRGVPELLVEVVSKGSVSRDYIEKFNDYARFGVKEYWIIDPKNEEILVFSLKNSVYTMISSTEEVGIAESGLLKGFQVTSTEIFS